MSIRSKEIYVSGKTKKRLYWIAQLEQSNYPDEPIVGRAKTISMDEIADNGLNEWMEWKYPNIKVLEKRLDALEGQLISELLNPTTEK